MNRPTEIDLKEALELADKLFNDEICRGLDPIERRILEKALKGEKFEEIVIATGGNPSYIRLKGSNIWNTLSKRLERKVNKRNVLLELERYKAAQPKNLSPFLAGEKNLSTELNSGKINAQDKIESSLSARSKPFGEMANIEIPGGPLEKNSQFYIAMPQQEAECYEAILKPAGLLRIQSPPKTGKTTLMIRILDYAAEQGFSTAVIDFKTIDKSILQSLKEFLQWLCINVGLALSLPEQIEKSWNDKYGQKISCTLYFEYLLKELSQPLVLAFDKIEYIYSQPEIAKEFFLILRSWHENAKKSAPLWKKLRLVLVYAEQIAWDDNNTSPFNVGIPIELPNFLPEQVNELANRMGLSFTEAQLEQFLSLVGTNPYLVHQALYDIHQKYKTVEKFTQHNLLNIKPYKDYPYYLPLLDPINTD